MSRRPSPAYSAMFSAFAAGAFLFVTGSIGYDVSYLRGFFQGGRWSDGPIWWQISLGLALVLLGSSLWRRLVLAGARPEAPVPELKSVGRGKTVGADRQRARKV